MRGTPLEPWFANKTYEQSSWVMQNLGNAFRMGLLSKVGGVYLDMDIISVNPMAMLSGGKGDGMARALTKQDAEWFNNAFLAFPRGDAFLEELMKEFVSGFRGFIWARNGPRMVTRTYQARCRPQKGPPAPECKGLKITSTHVFHPATYNNRQVLFDDWSRSCEFMGNLAKRSIGIHWWHRRVQDKVELNPESVLARVIAKSCPAVVESFGLESLGISEKVAVGIPESLRNEDPDLLLKKQTGAAAKKA
ncbi:alpha 1,4-glycosyltransferase conserved region-domain-containing protein [Zopfochytrium polystomum]|nr:alpha 1,4-glycosyltransferase conserved region-domain-containing protein [Zopfochytrium polystomum]